MPPQTQEFTECQQLLLCEAAYDYGQRAEGIVESGQFSTDELRRALHDAEPEAVTAAYTELICDKLSRAAGRGAVQLFFHRHTPSHFDGAPYRFYSGVFDELLSSVVATRSHGVYHGPIFSAESWHSKLDVIAERVYLWYLRPLALRKQAVRPIGDKDSECDCALGDFECIRDVLGASAGDSWLLPSLFVLAFSSSVKEQLDGEPESWWAASEVVHDEEELEKMSGGTIVHRDGVQPHAETLMAALHRLTRTGRPRSMFAHIVSNLAQSRGLLGGGVRPFPVLYWSISVHSVCPHHVRERVHVCLLIFERFKLPAVVKIRILEFLEIME